MPGRKVVSIASNKKHLTKKEREERAKKEAKLKQLGRDKIRPPTWLSKDAKKEFRRLVKEWQDNELLCNIDVAALAICCDAYSKYIEATKSLLDPETGKNKLTSCSAMGNDTVSAYVNVAQKYATIYKKFCSEFGLTPSSRLKLTLSKKEEEPDEFTKKFG